MQNITDKEQSNTRFMCTLTTKSCVHQEALREGTISKEQACTQCTIGSLRKEKSV